MGEGIVEKLKKEFDIAVEWTGVEIHPETPPEGRPLTELYRAADIERMMKHIREMGTAFGIGFADRPFLSNSRPALQAAEFARERGPFGQFHSALFSAYFSQGLDIGDLEILAQIARDSNLDADAMLDAVRSGTYLPRLHHAQQEAARLGVTGVPTFFIGAGKSVVGAQPLDVFRKVLRSVKT
ncbi:MAG TPA: DsbA family protein [Nitrospirota bacterium]|nr:DsbA family protein [Nitrospirota bacterium]